MPRSLSEWRRASEAWHAQQEKLLSNIKPPSEESVTYNWSSPNPFWQEFREETADMHNANLGIMQDNSRPLSELALHLTTLADAEAKKEKDLLQRAFPDIDVSTFTDKDMVEKINILMNTKEQYEYALARVKKAIELGGKGKKDNKDELQHNMAPTIASTFTSYLATELNAQFTSFAKALDPAADFSSWTVFINDAIDKAIDRAAERMFNESAKRNGRDQDEIYGDAEQWRAVGEAYRTLDGMKGIFRDTIRARINFDPLVNLFKEEAERGEKMVRRAQSKTNSGFSSWIRGSNGLKLTKQQYPVSGSVQELIVQMIQGGLPSNVNIDNSAATTITGKKVRTDNLAVYQFSADVALNAQQIANQMNMVLSDASGLADAAARLEDFYNRNLKNLNDTFLIYENVKSYSLGSDFSGFHGGNNMALNRLPDYIEEAGIDANVGMDFVYTAYNTLSGVGIFADMRVEVQEQISSVLTAAAAKLLFDDWATIGVPNTGAQHLHVLNLSGIIIPASVMFRKLGEAMNISIQDMRRYFSVNVHLPNTVVYHEGDWKQFGNSTGEIRSAIRAKWDEQFRMAEKESDFSIKFLGNFKKLLGMIGL